MQIGSSFPQIRSASSGYSKEQALIDLTQAENSPQDAIDCFKVISESLKPADDLKDSTDAMRSLLSTVGNGNTADVQSYYRQIANEREDGESMSAATATFVQLTRAEGSPRDASSDFTVIDQRLRGGESRADATAQFLRVLNQEGSGNTADVQLHYGEIHKSLRADEPRSSGVDAFLSQFKAESPPKDGADNYNLVAQTLKPGETRASATEQFLRVLRTEGNGNTSEAQADWKTIDSKVDDEHNRAELTDSFLRLRTSSKDAGAAREMFLLAH